MADVPLAEFAVFFVGVLLEAFFIHLSASFALGSTRFTRAFLVAVLGSVAAMAVFLAFGSFKLLAFGLVLVAWLAVCATVYRTTIWRSLFIGLFAYFLWVVARLVVESIVNGIQHP